MASGVDRGSVVGEMIEEMIVVDEVGENTRWIMELGGDDMELEEERNWGRDRRDEVEEQDNIIRKLRTEIFTLESLLDIRNDEKRALRSELERMKREMERVKIRERNLREEIGILSPKCIKLEQQLVLEKSNHEKHMRELLRSVYGVEGAGGRMTSTPVDDAGRKEWTQKYERVGSPEDGCRKEGGNNESRKGRNSRNKGEPIKKDRWNSKKERSSSRFDRNGSRSRSRDSLYSSSLSISESEESGAETGSGDEGSMRVRRSVLIREVPKISSFRIAGPQDVGEFFKEFENYCQEKLGENRKLWVKELGEFLDSRLEEVYKAIVNVGEPKYEVVKDRIIAQVRRIKGGVKYRKKNEFEEARMERGERLETYAQRLESLARKKFGNEEINANKDLMRKFLSTVPSYVRETINAKRKDKMKWSQRRLMWDDVLEMIEDREIEDHRSSREDREEREIMVGRTERTGNQSYREAVMGNTVEVMAKFLEDYEKDRERRDEGWTYVGKNREKNRNRNQNNRMGDSSMGVRMNEVRCLRCGRAGHMKRECAWANGTCFGCGQVGHLLRGCPNPRNLKCYRCGEMGHKANECGVNAGGRTVGRVCGNCGLPGHFARMCEKGRSTCRNCGRMGHIASVCRRPGEIPSQVAEVDRNRTQERAHGSQGN